MDITNTDKLRFDISEIVSARSDQNIEIIQHWFDRNFVKWFLSTDRDEIKNVIPHAYIEGEPEWMNKPNIYDFTYFQKENNSFLKGEKLNINDITNIIKYFDSLSKKELSKIYKQPAEVIFEKTKIFLDLIPNHQLKKDLDYNVFFHIKNNWKWVELLTHKAYEHEGKEMGHCSGSYDPTEQRIISLWDSSDKSHVTIEIWQNEVCQIKGKENKAPESKYVPVVSDFAEFLLTKGIPIVCDGQNIGWLSYNPNKVLKEIEQIPDPITGKIIYGRRYINPKTSNGKKVLDTIIKPHRIIRLGAIIEDCSEQDDTGMTFANFHSSFDLSDLHFSSIDEIYQTISSQKKAILESIIKRIGKKDTKKLNKIIRVLNKFKSLDTVEGFIDISGNLLKNLTNLPACNHLIVNNNLLNNLTGISEEIMTIWADNNRLENLDSLPNSFSGRLLLTDNNIQTLQRSSNRLNNLVGLHVSHNRLRDLVGSPEIISGTGFRCNNNLLKTLEGGPTVVHGDYDVSGNPLTDISSMPRKVTGNFIITKTSLCDEINHKYIAGKCIVKGKILIF